MATQVVAVLDELGQRGDGREVVADVDYARSSHVSLLTAEWWSATFLLYTRPRYRSVEHCLLSPPLNHYNAHNYYMLSSITIDVTKLRSVPIFCCAVLTGYQPKLKSLLSRSLAYAYIRRPAALFTCTVRYTRRPVAYLRLTRCCYISRTVDTAPLTYILYARQPYTGPRCWAQAYVRCAAFYNDDGRTADERKNDCSAQHGAPGPCSRPTMSRLDSDNSVGPLRPSLACC